MYRKPNIRKRKSSNILRILRQKHVLGTVGEKWIKSKCNGFWGTNTQTMECTNRRQNQWSKEGVFQETRNYGRIVPWELEEKVNVSDINLKVDQDEVAPITPDLYILVLSKIWILVVPGLSVNTSMKEHRGHLILIPSICSRCLE